MRLASATTAVPKFASGCDALSIGREVVVKDQAPLFERLGRPAIALKLFRRDRACVRGIEAAHDASELGGRQVPTGWGVTRRIRDGVLDEGPRLVEYVADTRREIGYGDSVQYRQDHRLEVEGPKHLAVSFVPALDHLDKRYEVAGVSPIRRAPDLDVLLRVGRDPATLDRVRNKVPAAGPVESRDNVHREVGERNRDRPAATADVGSFWVRLL